MDLTTKNLYRKISREAAVLANKRMRDEILKPMMIQDFPNPVTGGQVVRGAAGRFVTAPNRFKDGLNALSPLNLEIMKENWNPFQADLQARHLAIRINDLDNLYLTKLPNHDQIERIATDSIQRAVMVNSKEFFGYIINEWLRVPREDWDKETPLAEAYQEIMAQYGTSS